MTINQNGIGQRIKAALVAANVTQKELAKELSVSQSAVSAYTHGDAEPSVSAWVTISKLCDKSIDWLITGKERPSKTPQPTTEEALLLAITSDPARLEMIQDKLLHLVREKTPDYQPGLSDEEHQLIEAYHCAEDVIKEEALGMLVRSAERSEGRGGGGKGLKQSNGE